MFEKLLDDRLRVQTDGPGVAADERTPENPCRPARHVVSLEAPEQADSDVGISDDGFERDLPAFALLTETASEAVRGIHLGEPAS
jgi:hypothetical protein